MATMAIIIALCMGALLVLSAAQADCPGAKPNLTPCVWPLLFANICFLLHATGWVIEIPL